MNIRSRKMPEYVIYIFLWLLFLIIPLITNNYNSKGDLLKICYDWLRMLPFVLVFIINSIWLLPGFLFKGHTNLYIITLVMTAIVVSTTFQVLRPVLYKNDPKLLEQRILQDPQWGREEMRPGAPPSLSGNVPVSPELFNSGSDSGGTKNRRMPIPGQPLFQFINTLFIFIGKLRNKFMVYGLPFDKKLYKIFLVYFYRKKQCMEKSGMYPLAKIK